MHHSLLLIYVFCSTVHNNVITYERNIAWLFAHRSRTHAVPFDIPISACYDINHISEWKRNMICRMDLSWRIIIYVSSQMLTLNLCSPSIPLVHTCKQFWKLSCNKYAAFPRNFAKRLRFLSFRVTSMGLYDSIQKHYACKITRKQMSSLVWRIKLRYDFPLWKPVHSNQPN